MLTVKTLPENKCLFLVCVRLIVDDTTYEELAISQLMETHSTGRFVFEKIKKYFEVNKQPSNILQALQQMVLHL